MVVADQVAWHNIWEVVSGDECCVFVVTPWRRMIIVAEIQAGKNQDKKRGWISAQGWKYGETTGYELERVEKRLDEGRQAACSLSPRSQNMRLLSNLPDTLGLDTEKPEGSLEKESDS